MATTETSLCTTPGCSAARHPGRAKCLPHLRAANREYARKWHAARRASRPARIPRSERRCRVEDCTRPVHAVGLCHSHYKTHAVRKPCTHPGCPNGIHAQGLCSTHYNAAMARGEISVIQPRRRFTPRERFARHVDITPSCHLWTGTPDHNGRGHFTVSTESAPAVRVAYGFEHGFIPADEDGKPLSIDHGCRVVSCVRVDHLEPVTVLENARRRGVAQGRNDITQADGWLFGLAIPEWQKGADNMPDCVVTYA